MSLEMIENVLAHPDIATRCPLCGNPFSEDCRPTEEHIFPQWLQRHHDLWNLRLTVPNLTENKYSSKKIRVCSVCNNTTFGQLETLLSGAFRSADAYTAVRLLQEDVAIWLGKICWLLACQSNSITDFRTRHKDKMDRVLPDELMPGTLFLGMIERAFATGKNMHSCFLGDPPIPEFFYMAAYSIYIFHIDTTDHKFGNFDFRDDFAILGGAIRCGNVGFVCLFDGGLHTHFRSHQYAHLHEHKLHPMQFNEVVARIFHDQTVLDDAAQSVTYYWNERLNAVVAQTNSPRRFDPYMLENHDVALLARRVANYLCLDPEQIMPPDGRGIVTLLRDEDGEFLRYPVTQAELDTSLAHPGRKLLGPFDKKWRHPEGDRSAQNPDGKTPERNVEISNQPPDAG